MRDALVICERILSKLENMSYDFLNDNGDYEAGKEAMKEKAIEALSAVLEDWVHGGDADCIIAEFEEKLNNV